MIFESIALLYYLQWILLQNQHCVLTFEDIIIKFTLGKYEAIQRAGQLLYKLWTVEKAISNYPNCVQKVETVECVLRLVDYFMCEDLRVCVETFMEKTLCFLNAAFYFQVALQYRLNKVSGKSLCVCIEQYC